MLRACFARYVSAIPGLSAPVRFQARLLDDLLEVNRIAHGKIQLQREEVVIQSAVRDAIDSCRPAIEAKQLRLEIKLPPEGLLVLGDPTRLARLRPTS
jgi:signal transduction histidine kinase